MVSVNWYVYNTNESQSYAIYQDKSKRSIRCKFRSILVIPEIDQCYIIVWNINTIVQTRHTISNQFKRIYGLVTNPALVGKMSIVEIK
jgi:hypothetical protein